MTKQILVVDSSPRAGAVSRKLTGEIAGRLQKQYPEARVVHRDLAAAPLPHLTEDVITAFYTRPDQRDDRLKEAIVLSDAAVDELLASDIIVIGAPMWNFNVPSVLKAWIDHVVRAGRTFVFGPNGSEGLASGRKAIVVLSSGGIYSEGPAQAMDFHTTYLRSLLGFIGVTDVSFVRAEGVSVGKDGYEKALTSAEAQMSQVLGNAA